MNIMNLLKILDDIKEVINISFRRKQKIVLNTTKNEGKRVCQVWTQISNAIYVQLNTSFLIQLVYIFLTEIAIQIVLKRYVRIFLNENTATFHSSFTEFIPHFITLINHYRSFFVRFHSLDPLQ